ncbi:archaemetzincin [Flavobacterium sp. 17A]|uniref:Archaemetzincin n=1 Tax=Flavobacterium potami TaxID=2872310 RepID=A0A9X1H907_9FLAO|nr:archaemetzincin [Flavobacterium potami]MBZ4034381.1 archaemetzincin [Flavobacterium potami]
MKKLLFVVFVVLFACQSNKKESSNLKPALPPAPYFTDIKTNDVKLYPPGPGDWLSTHKEKGKSFEQFYNSKHLIPTKENNIIYLQPIGQFNSLQVKQIELVREYLEIFFQLKTKTLNNVSNDVVPKHARRIGPEEHEQFLAGFILDSVLKKEKLQNGIALMALTEVDLYPKTEWNYVFGLASYRDRVAVSSIYRLHDKSLQNKDFTLCLERLLKICSHEIGHMFGLYHCIAADCVMNGTNSLVETDEHTLRLCSNCQRKLQSGIKYNNEKRLTELEKYFNRNNLVKGVELMEKDLKSIQ